ncbi:MAG TPA: 16S rRNA (cytosine(1402)-N(4))-methyltransferase RsmH [Bacillota bacterium]|nr:16S rRNA (cytosine(1402)-N(4))-methyltransferase RsmH [Bacillota bacterium]
MFEHVTVLKNETVNGLLVKPSGTYVDCTVGGGGHSHAILQQLHQSGRLIAFDQDVNAIAAAKKHLKEYINQITFIHYNFRHLKEQLQEHAIDDVDGIVFDLGVSSPQLDVDERGFSYQTEAVLDMRMNQNETLTAQIIVNEYSVKDLTFILREYGEERFAHRIAQTIARERSKRNIETTHDLVEIVKQAIPAPARRKGGHPARRTFQALRIAVNDELNAIVDALNQAAEVVNVGGRIAVITFHSLEDRICKHAFRTWSTNKPVPRNFPIIPDDHQAPFKLITRKPITPSAEEIEHNKRARSAKLRIVEKVNEWSNDFSYEEGWRKT